MKNSNKMKKSQRGERFAACQIFCFDENDTTKSESIILTWV